MSDKRIRKSKTAAYTRTRRHQAAAEGKCATCCVRYPSGENKNCDQCLSNAQRKPAGVFCVLCAAHGFHRIDCAVAA